MMIWLNDKNAVFFLAAYGLAAVCLLGLAIQSWRQGRRAREALQDMKDGTRLS